MSERDDSLHDPGISRLYGQGAHSEPSAALDAAILSEARRAVVTHRGDRAPWWRRLRAPLAVAATAAMAVMLSLMVEREPAEVPLPVPAEQAPAPVERRQATLPQAAPAQPAKPDAVTPQVKREASAPRAKAAPAAERSEMAVRETAKEGAPTAFSEPASPPPPAVATESRDMAIRAAPATAGAAAPAPRMLESAAPMELKKSAQPLRQAVRPSPQDWVEEIRALRRQGRFEEAGKRLAELRQAYPDFALPDDLR